MASKTMLFGPIGRQVAIPCPESGMGMDYNLNTETTDLLSGEQAVWRSPLSYRTFNMSWTGSSDSLQPIIDVHSGLYGSGPYYLTDPVAAVQGNNLFPAKWASPFLLQHAVNGWSDPVVSSQAISPEQQQVTFTGNVDDAGEAPINSVVTCVPGSPMYYKAWGSATGAAAMRVYRYSKSAAAWTLPASTIMRTNMATNPNLSGTGSGTTMRTNLVTNPSFEVDTTGLFKASAVTLATTTYAPTVLSGTKALSIDIGPGANIFCYIYQAVDLTNLDWVAWSASIRWSGGSRYFKQRLNFLDASSTTLLSVSGPVTQAPSTSNGGGRYVISGQPPANTVKVQCLYYFYDDAAGTVPPVDTSSLSTDGWHVATATTQASAEWRVATYFDGGTAAAGDFLYSWVGTANASISSEKAQYSTTLSTPQAGTGGVAVTYRTSLDAPPGMTYAGKSMWTQASTGGSAGIAYTSNIGGLSGDVISARVWVKVNIDRYIKLLLRPRNGSTLVTVDPTTTTLVPANVWTELTMTRTATGDYTNVQIYPLFSSPGTTLCMAGDTIQIGKVLIEKASAPSEYFDGSTPAANGLTYGWTGTANSSTSQELRSSTFVPNTTNDAPVNILTQAEADARDIVAFKFVPYVPDASTLTLQHMDCAINDYRTYTPYQFGLDPSLYPSLTLFPGMALYPMGPGEPHAMFRAGKGVGPVQFTGNIGGSLTSAVIDRIGMSIDIREVARDPNN